MKIDAFFERLKRHFKANTKIGYFLRIAYKEKIKMQIEILERSQDFTKEMQFIKQIRPKLFQYFKKEVGRKKKRKRFTSRNSIRRRNVALAYNVPQICDGRDLEAEIFTLTQI